MNKIIGSIIGVIAVIGFIAGVAAYQKQPARIVGSQGPQGERGLQGPQGEKGEKGDRGPAGQSFGAVTSPDLYSPYRCLNGSAVDTAGSICEYVSAGVFLDATTTLAVIANPFSATSTITFMEIKGVNSTSTIDILVGTTTLTTAQSVSFNSQISPSLANATTIATSTASFWIVNGVRYGTGVADAGAGSLNRIVVGPNERIAFLATSTYAASSDAGKGPIVNVGNLFSGSYKILWTR